MLRAAALMVLAFGLVAQSMIGPLGEMHEVVAHAGADHGLAGYGVPHHHDDATGGEPGTDTGEPLHLLLHHSHCCGHSAWIPGGQSVPVICGLTVASLPVDTARRIPASEATAPFRPPIPA